MSQQNRTTLGAIGLTLGLVALMLIVILTALHAVGVDDALYFKLQMEAGILPEAGVSEDELRSIDRRLADYLRGDSAALEDACEANGVLFANCDRFAVDYANLWDPDGIHFRKELYPYWASSLMAAILMEGVE